MTTEHAVRGDIYAVTIEGEYYAHRNGAKTTGRYSITLRMDETAKQIGFLSVARNKLLPRALKAKYPDYKRFKTHYIVEAVNESKNGAAVMEIALMNRKQLVSYINSKKFAIESDLFPEVSDLREAIRHYRDNRETFLAYQKKREAGKGKELNMLRALDQLNPDIDKVQFTPEQEAQVFGQLPYAPIVQAPVATTAYSGLEMQTSIFDDTDAAEYPDEGEDVTDTDYEGKVKTEFDEADELDSMLDGV